MLPHSIIIDCAPIDVVLSLFTFGTDYLCYIRYYRVVRARGLSVGLHTTSFFSAHTLRGEQKKAVRCRDANTSRANREDNGIITDAGCLCTHYQLFMIVQLVVVSRRRSIHVGSNIDYKVTHQIISCYVSSHR